MNTRRHDKKTVFIVILAEAAIVLGIICFFVRGQEIREALQDFTRPIVKEVDMFGLNSPYSALIAARGGKLIGGQNAEERMYPASLTKMMTAILALEKLNPGSEITFTDEMLNALTGSDATQAGFLSGETVKVRDIVYGCLLPSGADCCMAIAYRLSGSEEKFADLMNKKAERLGMKNTHFVNSTGLHDEEHYSTAYDMALLLKYCLRNKLFREIITSSYHSTEGTNLHPDGITFYSTLFNNLSSTEVTGGEIKGGKTGFTNAAGLCLASFAEIDGREYVLVTAGAPGTTGEPLHVRDAVTVFERVGEKAAGV